MTKSPLIGKVYIYCNLLYILKYILFYLWTLVKSICLFLRFSCKVRFSRIEKRISSPQWLFYILPLPPFPTSLFEANIKKWDGRISQNNWNQRGDRLRGHGLSSKSSAPKKSSPPSSPASTWSATSTCAPAGVPEASSAAMHLGHLVGLTAVSARATIDGRRKRERGQTHITARLAAILNSSRSSV